MLRLRNQIQALADVANKAHDFHPGHVGIRNRAEWQSFAERIFSREISPRHGGINNHHCRGFFRIGGGEKAALHERHSERFEIIWSDGAVPANDVVVRRFWRTATDGKMRATAATADR